MSESEEPAVVYSDRRKITSDGQVKEQPFPSAQQLLTETNEEAEALLRKQAAEYEGVPYEGGGIEAPVETDVPQYRTVFQVAINQEGVPTVLKGEIPQVPYNDEEDAALVPAFAYDRDPTNRDIWLACSEIVNDINRAETSMVTVNLLSQQAAAGMARMHQAAATTPRRKKN